MRKALLAAAVVLALGALFWFGAIGPARLLPSLGAAPPQVAPMDLARLRAEFDADAGRTRVLALLSPS